jgi:enoyl-CoA hydratase/carnithine racemase
VECQHRTGTGNRGRSIEQALEIEAEAQAICMQTQDFTRAYNAFVAKEKPVFEGD